MRLSCEQPADLYFVYRSVYAEYCCRLHTVSSNTGKLALSVAVCLHGCMYVGVYACMRACRYAGSRELACMCVQMYVCICK